MDVYLAKNEIVNWDHPEVLQKAKEFAADISDPVEIARACYEFVRDEIKHSYDYRLNPVTCSASEVLRHKTGFCYAKSHLLAGLLRANGIPAGICYQRLTVEGDSLRFCLHALNAVYLPDFGWYRIDARGNKPGVEAFFTPPTEKLAFQIIHPGEVDLTEIWPEPLPLVVESLRTRNKYQDLAANLPDIKTISNRTD